MANTSFSTINPDFARLNRAGLRVSGLSKAFNTQEGPVPVISDVSFHLPAGTAMALTGDSGSGKSTLLHLIAGLEQPDTGTVEVDHHTITGQPDAVKAALRRDAIGLVFQQFNLIPSLTVRDNLAFQARLARRFDEAPLQRLARDLGLQALLNRFPEHLSGGQQQRVAIGRAILAKPTLILADEPTGNLDESTGDQVFDLLLRGSTDVGSSLVLVTHSDRLARRLDQRWHLHNGGLQRL